MSAALIDVIHIPLAVSAWLLAYPLYVLAGAIVFFALLGLAYLEFRLREREQARTEEPGAATDGSLERGEILAH